MRGTTKLHSPSSSAISSTTWKGMHYSPNNNAASARMRSKTLDSRRWRESVGARSGQVFCQRGKMRKVFALQMPWRPRNCEFDPREGRLTLQKRKPGRPSISVLLSVNCSMDCIPANPRWGPNKTCMYAFCIWKDASKTEALITLACSQAEDRSAWISTLRQWCRDSSQKGGRSD